VNEEYEIDLNGLALSPDNRLVAITEKRGGPIRFADVGLAKELPHKMIGAKLGEFASSFRVAAFSKDGKCIVAGNQELEVVELDSGKTAYRFVGHKSAVRALAVSPTQQMFASSSSDSTILLWDDAFFGSAADIDVSKLGEEAQHALWESLSSQDPPKAYSAMGGLLKHPTEAIAWLKKQSLAEPQFNREQVAKLISSITDDAFPLREKATRELELHGTEVEDLLRAALEKKPDLDSTRRINHLLERMPTVALSPDVLRKRRIIQILERMATPKAQEFLKELMQREAGSRTAVEAKPASERLVRTSHSK
jgi:hypothetical protein